jgi:hypothetical protein
MVAVSAVALIVTVADRQIMTRPRAQREPASPPPAPEPASK